MKPIMYAIGTFVVGMFASIVMAMLFYRAWASIGCLLDICPPTGPGQDHDVFIVPTIIFGVIAVILTISATVIIHDTVKRKGSL